MVFTCRYVIFFQLLPFISGLMKPMRTFRGEPDMDSVIDHVTLMEQIITTLQNQGQSSKVELAAVTTKLQTAEQTTASLQKQVQSGESELTTVKDKLQVTEEELKLADTNIAILKRDLQRLPDPEELAQLKREFEALKTSHDDLTQQINFAVSAVVMVNTGEIQSLKFKLVNTETELNKTTTKVANLTSEMTLMNSKLNQSTSDAATNKASMVILSSQMTDVIKSIDITNNNLQSLEAQINSFQSRQNITEHEMAEWKALTQSTAADLKTVQTRVDSNPADVNGLRGELAVTSMDANQEVAFQITQRGVGIDGWTTLKFDTVDYNTGNTYNQTTGIFTCPTSGTYIFWVNVAFTNPVGNSYIYIYKGSQTLATGACRVETSYNYYAASTTVISDLNEGDRVHITTDSTINYIAGGGYSSYGGALLHAS